MPKRTVIHKPTLVIAIVAACLFLTDGRTARAAD